MLSVLFTLFIMFCVGYTIASMCEKLKSRFTEYKRRKEFMRGCEDEKE